MHELSIALSILEVAEEEAERRGGLRVAAIHLKLGPLSGVDGRALAAAHEIARETSSWPRSRLVIEEMPVTVDCPGCGGLRPVADVAQMRCSACGAPATCVVGGRELEVVALEVCG